MKVIWLFPAGVLVGAALAWVFLTAFSDGVPAVGPGEVPDRPAEATPAGPPVALPPVGGAGVSDLHEFAVESDLAVIYWSSLAVVDAIAGRTDRFLVDAVRILKADGDCEEIQEMLDYLPAADRAGVMEKLIGDFPDSFWDRSRLSEYYLQAGETELAFGTLLKRLEADADDPEPEISGLVKIDPVRAGSAMLTIAEKHDWPNFSLIFCATELVDAGQPGLARPFLLKALETDAAHDQAVALMSEIDPSMAMELALKAVKAAPEHTDAWSRLAEIRRAVGDLAGAFEAYRQAATIGTDDDDRRDMMRGMIRTDPMAALPLIRSLAEGGDDETMGILGQAYLAAGEEEAAFGVFKQAHEFDPSDSEWLHRMVALDPERAALDFARKIEDSPGSGNDELLGTYALALERQGKLSDAYDEYLRAWRLDEEDWEWMRGMARTNPERAAALLEETYKENPEDGTVAGALADAYAGQRRTTEAVRLYEQAIDAGEDIHRWMAALAAVEPARGLPMLKAAVDEDPEDDEMWGALGDAYYSLGRMEEAKEAYDRALDIDPSDWEWSVQRARIR